MVKLRIFRWEDSPGLTQWKLKIILSVCKRAVGRAFTAEGNVMMETKGQREIYEDAA